MTSIQNKEKYRKQNCILYSKARSIIFTIIETTMCIFKFIIVPILIIQSFRQRRISFKCCNNVQKLSNLSRLWPRHSISTLSIWPIVQLYKRIREFSSYKFKLFSAKVVRGFMIRASKNKISQIHEKFKELIFDFVNQCHFYFDVFCISRYTDNCSTSYHGKKVCSSEPTMNLNKHFSCISASARNCPFAVRTHVKTRKTP